MNLLFSFIFPLKTFAQDPLVDGLVSTVLVEKIELEGNTLFSTELNLLIKSYENRNLSLNEIYSLKNKITDLYVSQGYVNSGAFLPSQDFNNNTLRIIIIEGKITEIEFSGLQGINEGYLKSRLPPLNKVFNINEYNNKLELLSKNQLISDLEAEIIPQDVGKSLLFVKVTENNPLDSSISLSNTFSPSVGSFGGKATISHNNLFGFGDSLSLLRTQTEGLRNTRISYSAPFNSLDGMLSITYSSANSEVITEEIRELGIRAEVETVSLMIEQPLIRKTDRQFNLGWEIEQISGESFVLEDFSFSFVEGKESGESNLTVMRFFQEYLEQGSNSLVLIDSQFNVGLDVFNATKTKLGIDGLFTSWQGNLQYLTTLGGRSDFILATKIRTQLTNSKLLPIEQFTVGGRGSLLGYYQNIRNTDNGVNGTLEVQHLLLEEEWGDLVLAPFFNFGVVWDNEPNNSESDFLSSIGLSLRYRLNPVIEAELNYGIPLVDSSILENTEVEDNLTFQLNLKPLKF